MQAKRVVYISLPSKILIEITTIMSMYWCCVCYLKWARNVYIIHGMRCRIDLLIKHEVKPSALSHHRYSGRVSMILHEAHTSADAYSCVNYIQMHLAHFKYTRVLCAGRLLAFQVHTACSN